MPQPTSPAWIRPAPNALTILRLGLALVLPFTPSDLWFPLVATAAVTDLLDGWIARRFHATSDLGRLLDGVADKVFAFSAVLTLILHEHMPLWQGLLVLARDLVVTALGAWLALTRSWDDFRHMQVRWAGKLTTFLAFGWFATLLLPAPPALRTGAFVLAAGTSLWAAADYLTQAVRLARRP